MTSSWFFLSTLNYDARSTTHQKNCYFGSALKFLKVTNSIKEDGWIANRKAVHGTRWQNVLNCNERRYFLTSWATNTCALLSCHYTTRYISCYVIKFSKIVKQNRMFVLKQIVCHVTLYNLWNGKLWTFRAYFTISGFNILKSCTVGPKNAPVCFVSLPKRKDNFFSNRALNEHF